MDLQPHLTGSLIQLRPLEASDFEALFAAAADPLIWEQHPKSDRYQRPVFEAFFHDAIKSKGALLILDKNSKSCIGTSRYYEFDSKRSDVVIGYTFLTRKYWGGKHNLELKSLMLDHAFKYVDTVLFHVGDTNIRSQKALIKIGAIPAGAHSALPKTVVFKISRNEIS
jgi:RimJ/RimL family protein N-acetyltransferase